jgi:hypothetical protein
MATSALDETVVCAVDELLFVLVSNVVVVTFAVLLSVPAGADGETFALMVNVAVVPAVSVAILQVTVAPVVQLKAGPLFCVSETNVVLAGSVSVQLTLPASDGPLLLTVIE